MNTMTRLTGHTADCVNLATTTLAGTGELDGLACTARQAEDAAVDALTNGDLDCTCRKVERLIDAPGIEKHVTITSRDVRIIGRLRSLAMEANADDRDAFQAPGYLYGDLHTAMDNYLAKILDNHTAAMFTHEYLLDTYGDLDDETRESIRFGFRKYGEEYGWIPVITWTD